VSDESALTVLAALADVGIAHYSRRLRSDMSGVRFPAYSAGRRLAGHSGNAHCFAGMIAHVVQPHVENLANRRSTHVSGDRARPRGRAAQTRMRG
jgi:hypothetical protein